MELIEYIDAKLIHEVHTSERKSFRACRRRWDWLFRQNYYPKITAKPLEFGVAYHKAMETYYNPVTWDWDREVIANQAILDFIAICEKQKAAAVANSGHLYLEGEQEEDYAERVELGKGMLGYYFTKVAPVLDSSYKPVKVEIKFIINIPNPETGEETIWCKCGQCYLKWVKYYGGQSGDDKFVSSVRPENMDASFKGLPVCYSGRLDALVQDVDGNYWIVDWKTAAQIRDDHEFLELDDQVASYCWALDKLGIHVRGFIYHEQRKAYPVPPKMNKQRRLGCLFSVSKSEPYEYNLYLNTVREQDKEAYLEGKYDDMLEHLKNEGSIFYARNVVYKGHEELKEIERNIGLEALDMIDTNLRVYPAPGRFGCNFCAFRQPCLEQNTGGDHVYTLDSLFEKMEHYYVRQEASTDSKGGE